ncbi:rhomboid family intramembrane serine protease [Chitinophaga lutea]
MTLSITLIIIIITSLVSFTSFNNPDAINKLSFWPYEIKREKQWYRFLTSGFIHNDPTHLIFNMLSLYFVGEAIEGLYTLVFGGKIYFLLLYVLGLILPDVSTYFKHRDNPGYRAVGASGAVSAVLCSAVVFAPWGIVRLFFAIPMPMIVFVALYLGISWYQSKRSSSGIAHEVHFWGAVLGIIYPFVLKPDLFTHFITQLLNPRF